MEGLVGYARRNFLVPVPSFPSFDALNAYLEERCLERLGRQLRGHNETIGHEHPLDRDRRRDHMGFRRFIHGDVHRGHPEAMLRHHTERSRTRGSSIVVAIN